MEYKVIEKFIDLEDNRRLYEVGQPYPREGLVVTEERLEALSTSNNRVGRPFIKAVENKRTNNEQYPKHIGRGYYELSNGEKVKGKEEALAAEKVLKSGE